MFILIVLAITPFSALSNKVSLGAGSEFYFVPEASLALNSKSAIFYNYKLGLTSGHSIGYRWNLTNQHTFSTFYGAVGSEASDCNASDNEISCAVRNVLARDIVNGLGIHYSYYFNGVESSGLSLRYEAGYANEQNKFHHGAYIFYQF